MEKKDVEVPIGKELKKNEEVRRRVGVGLKSKGWGRGMEKWVMEGEEWRGKGWGEQWRSEGY